ncbi:hypothetical protein [Spiroplasma endosymbiont of Dactylopius coccus]
MEKEINELEIILNQKLDKIPTILNNNFNHIKNKANDEKIDNLQNWMGYTLDGLHFIGH